MGRDFFQIYAIKEIDNGKIVSVELIFNMSQEGVDAAVAASGAVDGVIDTGVDVVTPGSLADYAAGLDARNIPHDWSVEGWTAPEGAFVFTP